MFIFWWILDFLIIGNIINNLPNNSIWVAESGIKSYADLGYISNLGFHAALIGSHLMKSENPGVALAELYQRVPV